MAAALNSLTITAPKVSLLIFVSIFWEGLGVACADVIVVLGILLDSGVLMNPNPPAR